MIVTVNFNINRKRAGINRKPVWCHENHTLDIELLPTMSWDEVHAATSAALKQRCERAYPGWAITGWTYPEAFMKLMPK